MEGLTPDQASLLLTDAQKSLERSQQATHLAEFVKGAWCVLEPGRELVWNWHLDALCAYLEAVHQRIIRRLIVNIPPGTMKSLIVSVFYPPWVWLSEPEHKFLCGSNEGTLATRDSLKMRTLVESSWYQERWGEKVQIAKEQREKTLFMNTRRGHRESQGVLGKITGKRGDTLIWDDAHDAKQTESDVQRQAILDAWDTSWSSRMNDLDRSAAIHIMQRVHQEDITGHLLKKKGQGWVHLAIPMRYDPDNTYDAGKDIGRPELNDPRTVDGELMFPGRFSEKAVSDLETDLGPYGTAGQLQQRPSPKGGGEMRRDWLCFYKSAPRGGNRYILVDPAGERRPGARGKKDNTAMGVIELGADKNFYLIDGYRDRLNLTERADILFKWHRQYCPLGVGYESYGMQSDIAHLENKMEMESYRFKITELGGILKKEDRIRRLIPILAAHRLWLPETLYRTIWDGTNVDLINAFIEDEYLPFPVGKLDDFIDMLSRICDDDMKIAWPDQNTRPINHRPHAIRDRSVGY